MSQVIQRVIIICTLITSMVIVISGCSTRETMKEGSTTTEVASIASLHIVWPSDVPLYPKSVQRFTKEKNTPDKNTVVQLSTDTIDAVKNFYNSELVEQGWTITSSMVVEHNSIYRAEKDNRVLFITVTGEDASVNIAIGVSKKV